MKKMACLLAVVVLVMAGCGGGESNSGGSATSRQQPTGGGSTQPSTPSTPQTQPSTPDTATAKPVNVVPLVVFTDIATLKVMRNGTIVVEDDKFNGTGEPGFDYFEVKNFNGDGWFGVLLKAPPPVTTNGQEISSGEFIVNLHSYSADLSCALGQFSLTGTVHCITDEITDTSTKAWQGTTSCNTRNGTLSVLSPDGSTDSKVNIAEVTKSGLGVGDGIESLEFTGSYIWDGKIIDLNSLTETALEEHCLTADEQL